MSGIYIIKCVPTEKIYIGKTIQPFQERWNSHTSQLNENKHYNEYMQRGWNKYGKDNFCFLILEEFNDILDEDLIKLEKYYIEYFDCKAPKGFNLTDGGDGLAGKHHSEESKKRISEKHKGKILSEETRERISKSRKGRYSGKNNSNFGKPFSEEHKRKLSENHADYSGKNHPNFGNHLSQETKDKIRKSIMGRKKSKNSSSKFFGVIKRKKKNCIRWETGVRVLGKLNYIGIYNNEISAAKAYDKFIIENNLDNPLNFSEECYEN